MNLKIFIKSVTYSAIFLGITLLSDYLTAWRSKKPFEPNLLLDLGLAIAVGIGLYLVELKNKNSNKKKQRKRRIRKRYVK